MGGGTALHRYSGPRLFPSVAFQFQRLQSPPLDHLHPDSNRGRWRMKDHERENMETTRKSEKRSLAVCLGGK